MITGPDALLYRPEMMNPEEPTGLWWCKDAEDVSAVGVNAVCKSAGAEWSDVDGALEWVAQYPYILLAVPPDRFRTRSRRN